MRGAPCQEVADCRRHQGQKNRDADEGRRDSAAWFASTKFTKWCYTVVMKRATVTIPDDIAKAVDRYVKAQEAPPPLTAVVQAALRHYLGDRGYLGGGRPLRIRPAERGSGHHDVSQAHDRYLAGR